MYNVWIKCDDDKEYLKELLKQILKCGKNINGLGPGL